LYLNETVYCLATVTEYIGQMTVCWIKSPQHSKICLGTIR